jgi:cell division protease FtsH
MNAKWRNIALWVIIVLLLFALFTLFQTPTVHSDAPEISFSQMLTAVDQGRVRSVVAQGSQFTGTFSDGRPFQAQALIDANLLQRLHDKGVSVTVRPLQENVPWYVSLLISWLPFLALIGVWIFLSRQMQKRKE